MSMAYGVALADVNKCCLIWLFKVLDARMRRDSQLLQEMEKVDTRASKAIIDDIWLILTQLAVISKQKSERFFSPTI
jgi:hypothetical protein